MDHCCCQCFHTFMEYNNIDKRHIAISLWFNKKDCLKTIEVKFTEKKKENLSTK